ncbi:MAG: AmmeMemoRadiSam system radical SAM enzyme [Minisyncoccales bacterium]
MKESYFYKKLSNNAVQCKTCSHFCKIKNNKKGICGVRKNEEGRLFVLNYEKITALSIDPIEKKPLYHFLPGTKTLSIAAPGCNFQCESCQNWRIAQGPRLDDEISGQKIFPEKIVETAKSEKIPSISYTYTEPTIFVEYALDVMKLAKRKNLKNIWVTNGYFSDFCFKKIAPFLDAVNIDLKSFNKEFYKKRCGGKLKPVLENIKKLKEKEIWIEITTLLIPTLNTEEEEIEKIAEFIKKELGPNTPWHISRFSGSISWKLKDLPNTSVETLKKAFNIGKKKGLNHVYIGNTPSLKEEDTYCSSCDQKLIERNGYKIQKKYEDKRCPRCNTKIPIIE